ncbi:hypothetical protein [Neochlamydia sp. S13]|uniref:hypothetical protein n=1 Tax=Neochlamydia sp. S13 TaxID=1353976 RepID=UPI0005AB2956|nr:hypothetical protein [Neochlamydia sp. S13]BBI16524.1 Probable cytochrome o ubiquinol oxidase chain I cyoB [Neochlamydia sp. S13]
MFGKLNLEAFKHDPIESGAGIGMAIAGLMIVALLFYFRRWKWLWNEWLTSLDHKKIGMMYIIVSLLMLFKGVVDALMLRAQQILAVGESQGFCVPRAHYRCA